MWFWPTDAAVLIPAYKSASLLRKHLPKVLEYAPSNRIIVVDDASYDDTDRLCDEYGITCLFHNVNLGKGAALVTGFRHIIKLGMKWIITMDADGQHAPSDLPKFIAASQTKPPPGICIGARTMIPGTMPFKRILSNRITSAILSLLCGVKIIDSQCGYRLYSVDLLNRVSLTFKRFEMESEVIMKAVFLGFPITFVKIQTLYFKGPSHISHISDTIRWISAVIKIRLDRNKIINEKTI